MKNRNVKLLMTLLTGVAIGTAIGAGMGILFSPRKGRKTRKKIKRKIVHTAQGVSNLLKDKKEAVT
ncbi:YtxH-like protein [Gillisia sp. Hel_I_86]|uniref:YtxH domain-containing protein n=1 Tax=Gillisia sp. Hel_I_86 TaxID=1249981 RepID=UPI001198CC46|nr:YtxH domain-containing protein [Gillisia sp. Hel_I_86]TVZ28427.1 YtxH-like protein [Gillisia sp. Hel_I_86]